MINNFDLIRDYLKFYTENTFYFIQLIRRRKDVNDIKVNNEVIHSYYVYNLDDFDKLKNRIIEVCNAEQCRAYITLNDLDLEKVALNVMADTARLIRDKEYKKIIRAWSSACGRSGGTHDKVWLLDLDGDKVKQIDEISEFINSLYPNPGENKIKLKVPTKNGMHLITSPFDLRSYSQKYNTREVIHKGGKTLLYCP